MSTVIAFGAASGICAAVLKSLAAQGDRFLLVGRTLEKLQALEAELVRRGAAVAEVLACDLSDPGSYDRVLGVVDERFSDFDTAIVAWGMLPDQRTTEVDRRALVDCIQTNFTAQVAFLNAAALRLEKLGRGRLVAIGSVAGDRGRQSNYAYGSCKAALESFCSGLSNRLHKAGVSLLFVKPGFVDTPMTAGFTKNFLFAKPENVAKDIVAAMSRGSRTMYTPRFWCLIMLIIRLIPGPVFRRMKL
ncbi:MAG: SDR family NAD(P)-dependent oxidoreductase [Verrucomicrobiota bacterium]